MRLIWSEKRQKDFTSFIELSHCIKKEKEDHFYIGLPANTCELVFDCLRGKIFYMNELQPIRDDMILFGLYDIWHDSVTYS